MKQYLKTQQNPFGQTIGFSVDQPPCQPVEQNLTGQYVKLIHIAGPISDQAASEIWQAVATEPNAGCWTYLPYPAPPSKEQLRETLDNTFGFREGAHFLIEVEGEVQGWIALLHPRLEYGAIEIGNVYYSHKMKQSRASTETIFLLLQQCFKHGFRRIEWKCDDCNAPSKAAALRFGFQYEGLFRQDRITKGRNRNTAWFSMLDEEWPALMQSYQQWLKPENFNAQGVQKQRLTEFFES